jgi:hypothetical protein
VIKVLVWCNYDTRGPATTIDSINALARYSRNQVTIHSGLRDLPAELLASHDAVIVHHSLALALDSYVSEASRDALSKFKGLKAAMVQDEYRFVRQTALALQDCGIDIVFTNLAPTDAATLYGRFCSRPVEFVRVLTGYVPDALLRVPPRPLRARPTLIGYRGREYPLWHGQPAVDRIEVAQRVLAETRAGGLTTDIRTRERDRLSGRKWFDFLRECRYTLAVESDVQLFDVHGALGPAAETFVSLLKSDRLTLRKAGATDRILGLFGDLGDSSFRLAQISPRCFESIALRTGLILLEGNYSGLLEPHRHYIELKRDYSNVWDAVEQALDLDYTAELIARAYAEVAMQPELSYISFVRLIDRTINASTTGVSSVVHPIRAPTQSNVPLVASPHTIGSRLRWWSNVAELMIGLYRRGRDKVRRLLATKPAG